LSRFGAHAAPNPIRRWLRHLAIIGLTAVALPQPTAVHAQVPAVPNAFPRSTTYTPGQLLYRSPVGQSRIANIIYHNGSIYTNIVTGADRKVWKWSDPNNAASIGIVSNASDIPLYNELGNHGHYKVGDYVGGGYDLAVKRQSVGVNTYSQSPDWTASGVNTVSQGTKVYFPWSTPFHWLQYAGVNGDYPAFLYRGGQKLFEWDALGEDGIIGTSILLATCSS
jgi:hypothetical protein